MRSFNHTMTSILELYKLRPLYKHISVVSVFPVYIRWT